MRNHVHVLHFQAFDQIKFFAVIYRKEKLINNVKYL